VSNVISMIHGEIMNANLRSMKIEELLQAFQATRATTIHLMQALQTADHNGYWQQQDPVHAEINPYLWEAGHVAWFQEYWVSRNPQRAKGIEYCAETSHSHSAFPNADPIFNSAIAPQFMRSQVSVEMQQQVRGYLQGSLNDCLKALAHDAPQGPEGLYFYRLALAHELMHIESFRIMGQVLGVRLPQELLGRALAGDCCEHQADSTVSIAPGIFTIDVSPEEFSFDNELARTHWAVEAFEIDRHPVSHSRFAAFIEDGGYQRESLWSAKGWQWRKEKALEGPRWFRIQNGVIERRYFGQWQAVEENSPMVHVSLYEAQAFCAWAGRRLPTEAQWLAGHKADMCWGKVWEWTADPFAAFEGFTPHPYREYSEPWFMTHQLVKGASLMTPLPLRDARYRNFYCAHRNDVALGFRTVRDW
jgi:gamma-glutamyl hercynylcysteine S-oxide synthase